VTRPRIRSIVFDCARPSALARFWAEVLGYRVREYSEQDLAWLREQGFDGPEDDPSVAIDPPDDRLPTIWFNRVPEPKKVKNRVHLDVNLGDAAEADQVLGLGATVVRPFGAVEGEDWAIFADPEGNEFCVFPPR
jgi:predicted enzyme related to lactoylglutathione lyase